MCCQVVLDDFTLELPAGKVTALCGLSGAGECDKLLKSLLMYSTCFETTREALTKSTDYASLNL